MQLAALKSSRYELPDSVDRFDRNNLFVTEARKYRNILECGCSTGFLSRRIAEGGARVVGIEVDAEAAAQARNHCAKVLAIDLNRSHWTRDIGEKFDLITFGDVLEHLLDPLATLREAGNALAPGGRVLISLPNVAHWTARAKLLLGRFEYQELGLLDYTHLRFFTTITAKKLIREAGYRIISSVPTIGGRFVGHFRFLWWHAAKWLPNLLAYQVIYLVEPAEEAGRP